MPLLLFLKYWINSHFLFLQWSNKFKAPTMPLECEPCSHEPPTTLWMHTVMQWHHYGQEGDTNVVTMPSISSFQSPDCQPLLVTWWWIHCIAITPSPYLQCKIINNQLHWSSLVMLLFIKPWSHQSHYISFFSLFLIWKKFLSQL